MAVLFIAVKGSAQCGVFLSAQDYINGKLTNESKTLTIPSGAGPDDRVICGGKKYMFTEIWGFKNNLSEYRIIYGEPKLIVCKGNIYGFTPYGPIKNKSKGKIVYYREVVGFGEIMITKDLKNPEVTSLADFRDLWSYMDTALLPKVKEFYSKCVVNNEGVMPVPEQIINYYNSLLPGYVTEPYTDILLQVYRE